MPEHGVAPAGKGRTLPDLGAPRAACRLTLVTIGLARLYLNETLERLQQVGVALCLCGAVAVSAA